MTQYVELFPLPDPQRKEAREIVALTKVIHAKLSSGDITDLAAELDACVWRVFGLDFEKTSR